MSGPTWSIPLETLIAKARGNLDLVARKTVLTCFRRVVMRTPVDTGRARGGWIPFTGSAPVAMAQGEDWFQGQTSGDTDRSGRATIAAVQGVVLNEWHPLTGKVCGIANNVPYIGVLENGRVGNRGSNQAPQGMVKITVAELGGIAQDAAAESQGGTWGGSQSPLRMGSAWDMGGAGE